MASYDTTLVKHPASSRPAEASTFPPGAPPMSIRRRPGSIGRIRLLLFAATMAATGCSESLCDGRRGTGADLADPGGAGAVLRAERPAAAGRELLLVPRRARSRRAACGSTRSRRSSRGETRARRSCPASRTRACWSRRSTTRGSRCPRRASSAPEKVAVLTRWVSLGAPWPAATATPPTPRRPSTVRETRPRIDRPADRPPLGRSSRVRRPEIPAVGPARRRVRLVAKPDRSLHPAQARSRTA